MKKLLSVLVIIASVFCFAGISMAADWTWSGAEDTTGRNGDSLVNTIGMWWMSGDKFADPFFTNNSAWTNQNLSDTNAFFTGTSTYDNINYTLNFSGSNYSSTLLYETSNNSDIMGRWLVTFSNAGGLSFNALTDTQWNEYRGISSTTPEPISSALFVLGGGILAFARRKK
ncbi:MAG TPA: PEP-CTERM sorting domain-containing protein [Candidatus Omnitrophota bacterium]|nr:PEP-CTERM sorting domain-containing protein [Candidatus Omnitrophota bacterium]